MKSLRYLLVGLIILVFVAANFSLAQGSQDWAAGKALTSSLVGVTNFGANPSNLRMSVYIPTTVKPNPPILVVVHWCGGSAEAIYAGTQYAALADQYGYMIVYPSTTNHGSCFDVSSPQALTRGGGSDPVGIMSMVTYAAQHYNGDLNQVYVTGISSGAMMTNVLLGDYPDVFKAGAAFAGVPFGCMATTDGTVWNSTCPPGTMIKTPQEWGNLVRAAYPGYSGPRPRMQLWHGTEDTSLHYNNFGEEIKQWTNVLGASQTPVSTDFPRANWTRTRYANSAGTVVVEAISEQGVSHSVQVDEAAVLRFFGLDGSVMSTRTATRTFTPAVSSTPTRTATRTLTLAITSTPTRTATRTLTTAISSTPTRTATRTFTPAITNTPTRTPTRTITPTQGTGTCSPVTATITAPFTFDGVGTFCWQSTNLGTYVNSWNTTSVTLNGANITNIWVSSGSYPAKINGFYYVGYNSSVAWGHFEVRP
jgi:acetylxylan esterase